jgi:signal transduction histidine kinase
MVFGSLFFLSMVQAEWYERFVHRFTVRVGLLLSAFTILMNTTLFTEYLLVYQLYIMVCIVATLVHFGISAFAGNILSGWMAGGFAVVALGVTNDILVAQGKISTGYWGPATVVFFVGLQAVLISRRFAFLQEQERSLRQRLLVRQTELATEALKAADAERQASAEAKTKVKLFQEAAHHLNNPLNHILGSKDIIGRQTGDLKEFLEQLVDSDDVSEDEYQSYHHQVAQLLDPCSTSLQTIDRAVKRASLMVGLLRRLSGMDGTSHETTSLDEIWNFIEDNSDHKPPTLSDVVSPAQRSEPVVGDPFILGKALIWLFDWLSVEELDSSIKVSVDSVSKSLVFHELDVTMFASARFHETQDLVNTLLKSYNCECTNNDGKLMLSLPFNDFSE